MPEIIRIILADDHALVLEGLRSLLAAEDDIQVIASATDGERLLDAVARFKPDVVITDIQMPYMDGLTCLAHIRRSHPTTRVLLLTANPDGETLQAVLASGADGLLLKTDAPQLAVQAIRQVMAGQLVFPAVARRWLTMHQSPRETTTCPLSEREMEVLRLVAEGLTNAQVAQQLHVSENTIKFHLQNIYKQLDVNNRTEASRWYHRQAHAHED